MASVSTNDAGPSSATTVSADQAWAIQENRLKAKARLRVQARARRRTAPSQPPAPSSATAHEVPSIGPNANLRNVPSTSRNALRDSAQPPVVGSKGNVSRTRQVNEGEIPLQRDKSLGDYIEFDLSKLHNSKGGFLIDENDATNGKSLEDMLKEKQRERQRLKEYAEPAISLDPETRPTCENCGSPEVVNDPFLRVFGIKVCRKCEREKPEVYSLLTKTEVKEDYLLTDSELKDEELLPHLLKANPHKATYSNMMLFCRKQVEEFAFGPAKWGSEQGLDAEFERREEEQAKKRGKKFQQGLKELRKRTRDNIWQKRRDEQHVHTWEEVELGGSLVQKCSSCGYAVELEVF